MTKKLTAARYAELFLTESQDNLSAINHALLELERTPTAREPVGAKWGTPAP